MKHLTRQLRYSNNLKSALLVHIAAKYQEADKVLGRTIIQKICYFLKFVKVPLPYRFKLYFYGPFSQELLNDMDLLVADGVLKDASEDPDVSRYQITEPGQNLLATFAPQLDPLKDRLDSIIELVKDLNAADMELYSTTHYIYWAYKNFNQKSPEKQLVMEKVDEIKEHKFSPQQIAQAFDRMLTMGMLGENSHNS